MIQLRYIPAASVDNVWADVSPLLERALQHGMGEHTTETILAMIRRNAAQLWVGQDRNRIVYAGVTHVMEYPTGMRVCEYMALGGERADEWAAEHVAQVEQWARDNGCTAAEMIGRPGWQKKLPGYKLRHVRLVKDLRYADQECA